MTVPAGVADYGVVLLEADHSVETLDAADWVPPAGLGPGFLGHPDAWPGSTVFAVADGATAAAAAAGDPAAMRGVAAAVGRLDGRCRVIVGGCGYFAYAWEVMPYGPATPAILSGLDLLDVALRATSAPVTVLSFSSEPGERYVRRRGLSDRVRVLGISPAGDWPLVGRPDWALRPRWTLAGLEAGLREVLTRETAPGGALHGVGGVVVECTVLPQFREVIREYTGAPVYDARDVAAASLR